MWIRGLVIIVIIIIREVFAVWLATLCVQIQSMHARVVHNYFLVDSWWYCMFHSCCHVYCSIVLAVSVHHRRKICADWYWNWRFEMCCIFKYLQEHHCNMMYHARALFLFLTEQYTRYFFPTHSFSCAHHSWSPSYFVFDRISRKKHIQIPYPYVCVELNMMISPSYKTQ